MALFKTKNPALGASTFQALDHIDSGAPTMTILGATQKVLLLGFATLLAAMFTWNLFQRADDGALVSILMKVGFISGFILALIIIFKKTTAPYLAPVYAVAEGLALGAISAFFDDGVPGIAMEAILLTFSILFGMLIIYRLRIIRVTDTFRMIVFSATAGIALCYIISMVANLFGMHVPLIHDNGTVGIVFSLVVVVVAALNLLMDFRFIEDGAQQNAPKYMEWYAAFGLLVTVIWLYLEILRLLAKLASRR